MSRPTMGLIAGGGDLPMLQARGMKEAGYDVACVGFRGQHHPDLPGLCDHFTTAGVLSLGRWARQLRKFGASQAVMVGKVDKGQLLYHPATWLAQMPSWRVVRMYFWTCRHDRRSQNILETVANEMQSIGIELIDTTRYIPGHLATPGVLTRTAPSAQQQRDIDFAWPVLMRMNDLDIGQAIAISHGDVIAVEAIEGTDRMIERAGQLCRRSGWLVAKGAPASKDPRFDVPTIGEQTIVNLAKAGAGCLAVAAGRVILLDKPAVLAAADKAGIAIVGIEPDSQALPG